MRRRIDHTLKSIRVRARWETSGHCPFGKGLRHLSCLNVQIPQRERRGCDRPDGDHEWQDRGIDVRMNREQGSSGGANEQRDEHARKPPPLLCCRGPVGDVARKKYDGCGRSSCKYTVHMKSSNCCALHPHRETPRAEKNGDDANRRPAVTCEPNGKEGCMRNQRYAECDRHPLRPNSKGFRRPDDSCREIHSRREAKHRGENVRPVGPSGVCGPQPEKRDIPCHKGGEDLAQIKKTDRVDSSRRDRQCVEQDVASPDFERLIGGTCHRFVGHNLSRSLQLVIV